MLDLLVAQAAKSFVLLALALVATILMRRGSAASRHLVWTVAVCGLLLLPVASPFLPRLEIGLPVVAPAARSTTPSLTTEAPRFEGLGSAATVTVDEPGRAGGIGLAGVPIRPGVPGRGVGAEAPLSVSPLGAQQRPLAAPVNNWASTIEWSTILLSIWIGGVLFGLGRIVVGTARLRWLQSRAAQTTHGPLFDRSAALARQLGLRRNPRLLRGDDGTIPMTWGVRRPVVILPAEAEEWAPWRLDAVLTHELGHIARRDYLAQLAAHTACAFHWFNPLVWVAAARMRVEREHACDDLVVRQGHEPSSYARELLELARSLRQKPAAATVAICFARPNRLRDRLVALMDETRDRQPLTRSTAVKVAGLAVILALPLAALAAVPVETKTPTSEGDPPPRNAPMLVTQDAAAGVGRLTESEDDAGLRRILSVEAPLILKPTDDRRALDLTPIRMSPTRFSGVRGATQEARVLCGPSDGESENHIHQTSNDITTITMEYGDCRAEVRVEGEIEFNEDFTSVSRLSAGAMLRFDVRRPGTRHRLEIEPGAGGRPVYDWSVGGNDQPFDAAAERWLADVLLDFFRSSAYKSSERAAWILRQEGPEGLLAEVERMWSGHAQSRYLTALLEDRSLSGAQVRRAIEVAGREVDSDHALGQVLQSAAENHSFDAATRGVFIAAAESIESDHTHGQVLATALARGDLSQENLEALLQSATSGIASDHQMAEILMGLAEKYSLDAGLRAPFLRAAATLESDHNQGQVYEVVLGQAGLGSEELAAVLEASMTIDSDHTLARLLIRATEHDLGDARLRGAFLEATSSIESDHNRGEVLSAALRLEGLTDGDLGSILSSASSIGSDHTLATLLLEVAEQRPAGPALRRAYLEAARSLGGDHDLSRALAGFVALDLEDNQLVAVLEVARRIDSDHNLANLLIEIGERHSIEGSVRDAFMSALDTIESEHTHDRVAATLVERR